LPFFIFFVLFINFSLIAIKPRQVGAGAAYLTQQTNGANTTHTCPTATQTA